MKTLKDFRDDIDALDDQIVDLLVERFKIVKAVGALKARESIAVVQSERAEAVKQRVFKRAAEKGLDGRLLRAIYTLVIDHAHTLEHTIDPPDVTPDGLR